MAGDTLEVNHWYPRQRRRFPRRNSAVKFWRWKPIVKLPRNVSAQSTSCVFLVNPVYSYHDTQKGSCRNGKWCNMNLWGTFYAFSDGLYVTITCYLSHKIHKPVQSPSPTDHRTGRNNNLMISTFIIAPEATNWQITWIFAIFRRISNWYTLEIQHSWKWCFDKKAIYFQNPAIWGHLYIVKNSQVWYGVICCQVLSLWQSEFSESERMAKEVYGVQNVWR